MAQRPPSRIVALLAAFMLAFVLSSCGSEQATTDQVSAAPAAAATEAPELTEPIVAPTEAAVTVEPIAAQPTVVPATAAQTDDSDGDHSDDEHDHDGDHSDDEHDHDGDHSDDEHDHDEASHQAVGADGYLGSYTLDVESFGTTVTVTVADGTRTIAANSLPDHDTGVFPNAGNPNTISAQSFSAEYTTNPVYIGNKSFARETGVAINGVTFEPGTAESVMCASGENYRVEGLQDTYDLGMDFNNAHVQPTGKYHYHGVAELLVDTHDDGADLVHVGFAADGFLMYYSNSSAYEASYQLSTTPRTGSDCSGSGPLQASSVAIEGSAPDGTYTSDWLFVDGSGQLDECNGAIIDGEYAYVLTDDFPYIPRCLNGEYSGGGPGGGQGEPPADGGQGGQQARPGQPDFTEAAAALGVSVEELQEALGGPPPDLDAAAAIFGITVEELRAILPPPPGR